MTLLTSCSQTSDNENNHHNKANLSIDLIHERDSLDEKILQSIRPLFDDVDTLVLDDIPPLYCGNATEQEITKDYFPIAEKPKKYINIDKIFKKKILLRSKISDYDPNFSTKVQLSIYGTICSKSKIQIIESYRFGFNQCSIEKTFSYFNNKWTYVAKQKECVAPIPEFKNGGTIGLIKFIQKNINYPSDSVVGKIFVEFSTDTNGRTQNIKILKGLSKLADKEVLRVVKLLDFEPALIEGKKVTGHMTIPISFKKE